MTVLGRLGTPARLPNPLNPRRPQRNVQIQRRTRWFHKGATVISSYTPSNTHPENHTKHPERSYIYIYLNRNDEPPTEADASTLPSRGSLSSPPYLQDTAPERMLSAFSASETQHYGNPREQANAIALSGEKELLTSQAMHEHAEELRAALDYDANSMKALFKATAKNLMRRALARAQAAGK